jgi:hypothetical protein
MSDDAHIVQMFDLVLVMRLLDMHNMCVALSRQCAERGRDRMGRRFARAAVGFKEMSDEVGNENRQMKLPT